MQAHKLLQVTAAVGTTAGAKKGRGVRSRPCLLCLALVLVLAGALIGTRIANAFTHGNTDSADEDWQAEDNR